MDLLVLSCVVQGQLYTRSCVHTHTHAHTCMSRLIFSTGSGCSQCTFLLLPPENEIYHKSPSNSILLKYIYDGHNCKSIFKKNKNIFWGSTCSPVTACSSPGLSGSPASSPSTEGGSRQTSAYPRLHPFLSGAQVPLRFCQNADSDAEVPGWGPRLCIPEKLQADGDDVVPGTPSVCPRRLQRTLLL